MSEQMTQKEVETMQGYVLYALRALNAETFAEYDRDFLSSIDVWSLLYAIDKTQEDLTKEEAQKFYLYFKDKG